MDAQTKKEVKDFYDISDSQLDTILNYPDKTIILKNGRHFIYSSDHDMVAEIEGISYKLPDSEKEVDSLEDYLKYIKDNDIQSLDEVIEDIGDTPITEEEVEVMERFKTNPETIKNIWEKI